MARIQALALIFASLLALVSASSAPTFCKCTCFKNSTIIPLGPKGESSGSPSNSFLSFSLFSESNPSGAAASDESTDDQSLSRRSLSTSCSECTKSFCLSQGIDFCKEAKEENVVTMCFQRDSNKDKIIVWGFILGTVGLLGWAAFKRVVEVRGKRAMSRQDISYAPVSGERR
ncbi:putative MFS transporter [Metarhizium anisopliae]|uniref:MFS transporter n=2 Tax=Metarhizium TaxID=5529 RepID=A0A0D9PCW6_METAN